MAEPTPRVRARRSRRRIGRVIVYAILIFAALFYLFPLLVMVLTSLKPMSEIQAGDILRLPQAPSLEPWRVAWSSACVGVECVGIHGFYENTILMVIPAVLGSTLIGALNGFALTKYQFPGGRFFFGLLLVGAFTPYQAILLPLARTLGYLGLAGTLAGLSITHTIYGLPFTTAFARSFYLGAPQELVKAAQIDGAGFFRTFWSVMIPISLPILIVSIIYQFTNIWNDFLFGAALTYGQNAPIMVALNNIVNTSTGEKPYNVHMAAAIMAALPTMILYLASGKYFIRGLMVGSVKG
jgi:glucose/mannose transport system permease protein